MAAMSAAIYFDNAKWFAMLRGHGCTPVDGKSVDMRSQPHFLWQTAWGHKFLVPHHCTYSEADDIIAREVTGTRPTGN